MGVDSLKSLIPVVSLLQFLALGKNVHCREKMLAMKEAMSMMVMGNLHAWLLLSKRANLPLHLYLKLKFPVSGTNTFLRQAQVYATCNHVAD